MNDEHLGQIVFSRAGRDKGRYFIIIDKSDEDYVLISDGDLRRLENPKKKKIKHLIFTNKQVEDLFNKKTKLTNADLKKALIEYLTDDM